MMKSLAIGLLTLSATCSTAAFADDFTPPQWTAGESWWQYVETYIQDWEDYWSQHDNHQSGSGPVAAPEIDPASAAAALTLLAGGLVALRGRRSAKKDS